MNRQAVKLDVNELPQTKPLTLEEQTGQIQIVCCQRGDILRQTRQESNNTGD